MTQEEFKEYIEVWNKEYSAMCERKRIVEQLYAKDNGRFAAGSPVILKEPYLDLPAGVYVTTCVLITLIILFFLPLRDCTGKREPVLISSDTTTTEKKNSIKPPDVHADVQAETIIKYRDRIIYKDRWLIETDSLLLVDTLLQELSIVSNADTTIVTPVKVNDSTWNDTITVKAIFRFPENRMVLSATRNPIYYTTTTKTITNSFVKEKPTAWLDNLLYFGAGFAAGAIVDRVVR